MATEKEIRLKFRAEVNDLKKNLLAAGMSADDTARAVKDLANAYKAQVREAKKAASAAGNTSAQIQSGIRGIEKSGQLLGGTAGQVTGALGDLWDMVEAGGGALGVAGMAAGATVGALTALAGAGYLAFQAMDSLAESTRSALSRLGELRGSDGPSKEAADAVEQWDAATLQLEAAVAELTQTVGAELLPAAADLVREIALVVQAGGDWAAIASDMQAETGALTKTVAVLTGGMSLLRTPIMDFGKYLLGAREEVVEVEKSTATFADTLLTLGEVATSTGDLEQKGAAITAAAAREKEAASRAWLATKQKEEQETKRIAAEEAAALVLVADATAALLAIQDSANADLLTQQEALAVAYQGQVAEVERLEQVSGDHAAAEEARAALSAQYARDVATVQRTEMDATLLAAQALSDQIDLLIDESAARAQQMWSALGDGALSALTSIGASVSTLMDNAATQAERTADEFRAVAEAAGDALAQAQADYDANAAQWTRKEKKAAQDRIDMLAADAEAAEAASAKKEQIAQDAAMRAYEMQQAAAQAGAIIAAAQAYMAMLPFLAASTFAAPAIAAGIVGTALGLQLAAIESAPPPTFHQGGVAELENDEMSATLRRGEAVLTPAATARLGRDQVDALNAGQAASGPGDLEVHLDRRLLGRAVGKVVKRGKAKRVGVAPAYRRG